MKIRKTLIKTLAMTLILTMVPISGVSAASKKVKAPAKVSISSVKQVNTKATVKWKKLKKTPSGYAVYVRKNGGKWKLAKKTGKKTTKATITVSTTQNNSFKVRAFKKYKVKKKTSVTFVGIDPAGDIENTNTVFIDTETAWVPMLRMWVAFLDKFFPGKEIRLEYVSSEPGCDLYWTNRPDFAGKYHVEYLDPERNDTIFIDASSKTDVLKELTNHMIKQNPNALSKIKSLGGDINSIDTIYAELADSEYSGFEYSGFTGYLSVAKWEHVNPCECD